MNNVTLSEETMKQLTEEKLKPVEQKKDETQEDGLWIQVLRSPIIMKRLAICSWWWITCTFVFYGMAINSVSLAGDKYTNYMLVVSVEVIAVVTNALVLDRIGRKRTLLAAYVVCGFSLVAITFVPVGKLKPNSVFWLYEQGKLRVHALLFFNGRCDVAGDAAIPGRQGGYHAGVQRHLHVHIRIVPDSRAPLTARLLFHDRPHRIYRRTTDAAFSKHYFNMQLNTAV